MLFVHYTNEQGYPKPTTCVGTHAILENHSTNHMGELKWILAVLVSLCCGCGPTSKDAISHFSGHDSAILELATYFGTHQGIDYVEFRDDGLVDLWVLDREHFDRKSSPAKFKHKIFRASIESAEVSAALEYAGVSDETFSTLQELANKSGCISVEKPFWDSSEVEIEVGYARLGMSKFFYRKFKNSVDVNALVALPPYKDNHVATLGENWTLIFD